jgi:hypothetical protein
MLNSSMGGWKGNFKVCLAGKQYLDRFVAGGE